MNFVFENHVHYKFEFSWSKNTKRGTTCLLIFNALYNSMAFDTTACKAAPPESIIRTSTTIVMHQYRHRDQCPAMLHIFWKQNIQHPKRRLACNPDIAKGNMRGRHEFRAHLARKRFSDKHADIFVSTCVGSLCWCRFDSAWRRHWERCTVTRTN